jgi:hypothetical protein
LLNGTDLLEGSTGKRFASLDMPARTDAQYLGAGMLALLMQNPDRSPRLVVAKLDDAKIRELASKPK